MIAYEEFVASKRIAVPSVGIDVDPVAMNGALFPHQRDLARWAMRKGRAAIFADTGLGKTLMQLEWAQHMSQVSERDVLILAPLGVARQTVEIGDEFGYDLSYQRSQQTIDRRVTITNYEMLDHFDPSRFGAVVLDESSILKSFDGKTRTALIQAFRETPYRLCCTATPAPNDVSELANHAEFLGVMSREDMLATFFVHDSSTGASGGWRLKGHAEEQFYRWLASWSMSIRTPSDLGYPDDGYDLPPLSIDFHFVDDEYVPDGQLFAIGLSGIQERTAVRKATIDSRCQAAADLIAAEPSEPWLVWCGLNDEGERLATLIPDAIMIQGSDSPDTKADAARAFIHGSARVLISKPSIFGFGMNFQHCARQVFVGLSDSYEQYYQAIRRCYRFGQTRPVNVHVILAHVEDVIAQNILRKEEQAATVAKELVKHVAEFERAELAAATTTIDLPTAEYSGENWKLLQGDACERLREVASESVDFTLYSPPFGTLYAYSPSERDLGNSRSRDEFFAHYRYFADELLRVIKPGRITALHVQQEVLQKVKGGIIGMHDLRGDFIRAMEDVGFIYHGEVCIDKDPQAQAIRTKAKGLMFVQLRKDASWMRQALADYILLFRKPGENAVPIHPDITNDEWIEWARPIWYGIKESDTLNVTAARTDKDERHICPLQLGTIERCIRLWSNPGDLVLDPFSGIGSVAVVAIKHGRRFIGTELKPEYARVAARNIEHAVSESRSVDLFNWREYTA